MSKVLLVNPRYNYSVKNEMYPSGALMLLGTMAKLRGHEVKIVHMASDKLDEVDIVYLATDFDIVGITINTFQVASAKLLVKLLKAGSKSRIVIGGPHITSIGAEEAKREFPVADDIICGEGEHQFMSTLDKKVVESTDDLEYITPPDLSLVNLSCFSGAYPLGRTPAMFMMASRGCPNQCTFCNRAIFGNKVRYRSPENVIRELNYFANYGIKEVFIQDDTFNLNNSWCEDILQRIVANGLNEKMQFRAPFRADEKLVNERILRLAKRAGFWLLFYGVESGSQGMLDRMNKRLSLDEIERAIRLTKEAGIKAETSFIVGLPGETELTARDTINFYHKLSPFWSGCGIAIPFPSTELYKEVSKQIDGLPFEDYRPGMAYFRTDELSKEQIYSLYAKLDRAMMQDKVGSLLKYPSMLIRTVRDKVG